MSSLLYISSRDRSDVNDSASSFQIPNLEDLDVNQQYLITVSQVTFPKIMSNATTYNFRPWVSINGAATAPLTILTPGVNYDGTTLATAITTALTTAAGEAVTATYDATSFSISLTAGATKSISFKSASEGYYGGNRLNVTQRFLELCGWLDLENLTLNATSTWPSALDTNTGLRLLNTRQVKLNGTDYIDVAITSTTNALTSNRYERVSILSRIPTSGYIGTVVEYTGDATNSSIKMSGYNLNNLRFFLRDEWNDVYAIPKSYALSIVLNLETV